MTLGSSPDDKSSGIDPGTVAFPSPDICVRINGAVQRQQTGCEGKWIIRNTTGQHFDTAAFFRAIHSIESLLTDAHGTSGIISVEHNIDYICEDLQPEKLRVIRVSPAFLFMDPATQQKLISASPAVEIHPGSLTPDLPRYDNPPSGREGLLMLSNPVAGRDQRDMGRPSISSLHVVSSLRNEGIRADISLAAMKKSKGNYSFEEIDSVIRSFNPAIVGLTAFASDLDELDALTRHITAVFPSIFVAAGGPMPTMTPELSAVHLPAAHIIFGGESERSLPALVRFLESIPPQRELALDELLKLSSIGSGYIFRQTRVLVNSSSRYPERLSDEEMNQIQLDYSLLDFTKEENRILRLSTSRGCPRNCSFCSSVHGRRVRAKSEELILSDMRSFVEAAGRSGVEPEKLWVDFPDDDFFVLKRGKRALEIMRRWAEDPLLSRVGARHIQMSINDFLKKTKGPEGATISEIDMDFVEGLRSVISSNPEVFRKLKLVIGTDASSDEELAGFKKGYGYAEIIKVADVLAHLGIQSIHYLILTSRQTRLHSLLETIHNAGKIFSSPEVQGRTSIIAINASAGGERKQVVEDVIELIQANNGSNHIIVDSQADAELMETIQRIAEIASPPLRALLSSGPKIISIPGAPVYDELIENGLDLHEDFPLKRRECVGFPEFNFQMSEEDGDFPLYLPLRLVTDSDQMEENRSLGFVNLMMEMHSFGRAFMEVGKVIDHLLSPGQFAEYMKVADNKDERLKDLLKAARAYLAFGRSMMESRLLDPDQYYSLVFMRLHDGFYEMIEKVLNPETVQEYLALEARLSAENKGRAIWERMTQERNKYGAKGN